MILAEPRHEPKVRQGVTTEIVGVDGNGFAPFRRREDLEAFVQLDCGLDGRPRHRLRLATRSPTTSPATTARSASTSGRSSATASCGSTPSAGTTCPPTRRHRPDARHCCATRMAEGAVGLSTGLDYPPGQLRHDRGARRADPRGRPGAAASTTATSATRSATAILDPFSEAIEIGRRGEAPAHITHFYHRQTHPGGPEHAARARRRRPRRGPRRHLRLLSVRVGEHAPAHPAAAAGSRPAARRRSRSGSRTAAARDRIRDEFDARGAPTPGRPAGRTSGSATSSAPTCCAGRPQTLAEVMAETGHDAVDTICDLLLAEDLGVNQVTSGPWSETLPPFVAHPVGMVGTDSTFIGAKPSPRTYGSYPRILGQFVRDEALLSLEEAIRKMTGAAAARLGLTAARHDPRRRARRPRRLRPGDGPQQRHLRRAAPVPRRHRARHRQRRRSSSRWREHTGATPGRGIRLGVD